MYGSSRIREIDMAIEVRNFSSDIEWRVDEHDDSVTIKGHAAVFDKLSEEMFGFREKVAAGAFTSSLERGDDVRALFNHDPNFVLGRTKSGTLRLNEDDVGLAIEIDAPLNQTIRDLVLEPIRRGDVDQMSFGFVVVEDSWNRDDNIRTLMDVELFDVSPVTYPAYPDTDVAVRDIFDKRKAAIADEVDRRAAVRSKLNKAVLCATVNNARRK